MAEVRHRVADAGVVFALRAQARQIADNLRAAAQPGDTVTLDFAGVKAITNCFADELLAGLTDRHVVTHNTAEDVRDALETARARREQISPGVMLTITASTDEKGPTSR